MLLNKNILTSFKASFQVSICFLILWNLSSFTTPNVSDSQFIVKGFTQDLNDETKIILINSLTDEVIDSTRVLNNSFTLKGTVGKMPLRAAIFTSPFTQFREFWIEPGSITFDASQSLFRDAIVTGSSTEVLSQELDASITNSTTKEERIAIEQKFIRQYPDQIVSAYLLSKQATLFGKENVTLLYNILSEKIKKSDYGIHVLTYIQRNKNLQIGSTFEDFEMTDQQGVIRKLSDLKGKTILLEFWASWCAPCRKGNPALLKTYNEFHKKGFEIFAVSIDTNKKQWKRAIQVDNINWIQVSDLKGNQNEAYLMYGVHAIPSNFLINKQGIIIAKDIHGDELIQQLQKL